MILEAQNSTLNEFDKVTTVQLGYCNAFKRFCYIEESLQRVELVSYCTPVVGLELDVHQHVRTVECAPAAICSATTRKHVSRFLNESTTTIDYYDIKRAIKSNPLNNFGNGLRVITEIRHHVYGLHDVSRLFDVRYTPVKAFEGMY